MYAHTTDQRPREGGLVNRSFWISDLPRPLLLCRVFGHRPVVEGTTGHGTEARWVACDRCGVRPCPQGSLDPDQWNIGAKYPGPFDGARPWETKTRAAKSRTQAPYTSPGAWPKKPTWTLGGQLVVGAGFCGPSVQVKVGNAGSEHVLAAHLALGRLGGVYLHTEDLGTWWQRRLNPTGYESKVTGINAHDGRVRWRLWVPRNTHDSRTPRWRDGSARYNLADILLGERRYSYEQVGDPVSATLRLPHGDDHLVHLQLERVTLGRARGRRRTRTWSVDWECPSGIPTRPGNRGRFNSANAAVGDAAAEHGDWASAALAAIATRITTERAQHGYAPPPATDAAQLLAVAAESEQATTQAMRHLTDYVTHGDPEHLNRAGQAQERAVESLAQITGTKARR